MKKKREISVTKVSCKKCGSEILGQKDYSVQTGQIIRDKFVNYEGEVRMTKIYSSLITNGKH